MGQKNTAPFAPAMRRRYLSRGNATAPTLDIALWSA